jgi:hypothetical protein
VRLVALGCLLVGGAALAQPAPEPLPPPLPAPDPVPAPDAPVGTDPDPGVPQPMPPAPVAPEPVTVPEPAPKPLKQSATEERLAATALCAAQDPRCDWLATFSSLERASIRRTLAEMKLEPEPAPWGKPIGRVHVNTEDVFAENNWLRFFNVFHVTTRDVWVRSELTIREGELWDDDRIAESQRRVKDPLYHSVVALLPVKSPLPGKVDLLVVTRDIWSLRLNTQYTFQQGTLTNFIVSLSETNFLGRRKTVALSMIMDQGAIAAGPLYIDKNWLRTDQHFDLRMRFDRIFTRRSLDIITRDNERIATGDPGGIQDAGVLRAEGSAMTITLARPLWSLATKWALAGSVTYRNAITRQYLSTGLRAYDAPETMEIDNLPRQFRMRTWSTRVSGTRQWGTRFKHQLETGYNVTSARPSLLPTFAQFDPMVLESFRRDVFPRSEVISNPFVEYSFFQPRFKMLRNLDTYELAEDYRFGLAGSVALAQSLTALGSSYNFTRPSATLSYTIPWGQDGLARAAAGGQLRIQGGSTIDNTATAQLRAATPTLASRLRFVGQIQGETRWNDSQNQFYALGSENGLRAYNISQFIGDRRINAQLEARSVPIPIWVVRVGGVVFYDGGGAADSFRRMRYVQDVGFGLRMLVPHTSRELFRFDLAFPLNDAPGTRTGRPRFIAGFDSYF